MALEPVSYIIKKIDHWPLAKRREYLMAAFAVEKGRWRRKKIHEALRDVTTRVLRQERRNGPA